MTDFIVSPRFDRPPPVGGWFKSALGTTLWEAPLYAAIAAASLSCSYAPPARAGLSPYYQATTPEALPFYSVPSTALPAYPPGNDTARNSSQVLKLAKSSGFFDTTPLFTWFEADALWDQLAVDDGPRNSYLSLGTPRVFLLGTHNTAPEISWLDPTTAPWEAFRNASIFDGPRNSWRVWERGKLVLGTHDTTPNPAWMFSVLPNPIPPIPPGTVELLISYRPLAGPVLRLGIHDTAPLFSWIKALNLKDLPPPDKQSSSSTRWKTRLDSTFRSRM